MWRGLAHAIENAMARAFGRSTAQIVGDWWGWAPLGWALLAALLGLLIFRTFRLRHQRVLTVALAASVFVGAASWQPARAWVSDQSIRSAATQALRGALINPQSARISDLTSRRMEMGDTIVCGWVNAKARNGAFQGPQLFAVIVTPARDVRTTFIDSACYASQTRDFLGDDAQCETIVRAERPMLSGSAHSVCGIGANGRPEGE